MTHANRRWPTAITANLWPYALRMSNDAENHVPNLKYKDGRTPMEAFAKTSVVTNPKHWHHFGCPAYVLDGSLQGGAGIFHKWKERARVGIYIGRSPQHARSVALVLNLKTGHVSPQFHIKFDPSFHTTKGGETPPPSLWQTKAGFVKSADSVKQKNEVVNTKNVTFEQVGASADDHVPRSQVSPPPPKGAASLSPAEGVSPAEGNEPDSAQPGATSLYQQGVDEGTTRSANPDSSNESTGVRKSRRRTTPTQRLIASYMATMSIATSASGVEGEIFSVGAMFPHTLGEHPLKEMQACAATSDPDTMYLHQAMKEPDKEQFLGAMNKEVNGQVKNKNFSIVPRSTVPEETAVLPSVWAMKRKRRIDTREVYKWKARLNIDGSKQVEGRDYEYGETYAPVASWASIRMLLIMAISNGWYTRQLDFVMAYSQAPIDRDMYMEIPRGYKLSTGNVKEFVLKVHKNIYGQKQAGRVWNDYLVAKLIKIGFVQSRIDPCIFTRGRTLYALYTDNSILTNPCEKEIQRVMEDMRQVGLDITDEGNVSDFLGVKIDKTGDKASRNETIHLSQPQLIDNILKDLQLDHETTGSKSVPMASSKILFRHSNSKPFDGHFHYRSVIGKLNYLEKCTRPDIAYAVHQCARFAADPKVEHGKAVMWIGRYLLATRDKGMILKPNGDSFNVSVDADFSGNWDRSEAADDADTARSRHGYIVSYAGCPMLWASKLQTEVALSSTESEVIGLSEALRAVIPLMELMKELKQQGFKITDGIPKIFCRIFEDNSGALEIATVFKLRPRTKHLNTRFHHFRQYQQRGEIEILPIDTSLQTSDFLTKPVDLKTLVRHRLAVMGW